MNFIIGSNCEDARQGLRAASFNPATGEISQIACVEDAINPIFFAWHKERKLLYVAEHVAFLGDTEKPGGISVFRVDTESGEMTRLASCKLAPTVPCHVSLSPDGTKLAWAEYRKANAGVLSIHPETGMISECGRVHHEGHGPNPERQEAAHCHFAAFLPDNKTLLICDLGIDRIVAYTLTENGLVPNEEMSFTAPAGSGPRHLAFLSGTPYAFLVTELSNEIYALDFSASPKVLCSHTLLPAGFTEFSKAAAIRISPDRRWVLASNRGHNSIAAFRIDEKTGMLAPGPISALTGEFPRDFIFSPDGKFILAGHKLSNEVAVYSFDTQTGALTPTSNAVLSMVKPLCFAFL